MTQTRDKHITLYLTSDELALLERLSADRGLDSEKDFVRRAIRSIAAYERALGERFPLDPDPDEWRDIRLWRRRYRMMRGWFDEQD